jgi:hypothetical protein
VADVLVGGLNGHEGTPWGFGVGVDNALSGWVKRQSAPWPCHMTGRGEGIKRASLLRR